MQTIDIENCGIPAATLVASPVGVSERYSFIPTNRIIEDMAVLGWLPVKIQGCVKPTALAAKHVVRLRRENDLTQGIGEVTPEIVIMNSHDGLSAFRLRAGLFRLVCSNGLVVSDGVFRAISIRHIRYSYASVKDAVVKFADSIPCIIDHVSRLKGVILSDPEKILFAAEIARLRFPTGQAYGSDINITDALRPTRKEDAGNSLWCVFNMLQEKILQGLLITNSGRKVRKIGNVQRDIELNQQMFAKTLEFASHG